MLLIYYVFVHSPECKVYLHSKDNIIIIIVLLLYNTYDTRIRPKNRRNNCCHHTPISF